MLKAIYIKQKDHTLKIDFSEYLGHSCSVQISDWKHGVDWFSWIDGKIVKSKNIMDELGIPLRVICSTKGASLWVSSIPSGVLKKVLKYEMIFNKYVFQLLYFISHYQYALDLFNETPILIYLILHTSQKNRYPEQKIVSLFGMKRIRILNECGLSASKSRLKTLNKLRFQRFGLSDLKLVAESLNLENISYLNHLMKIDLELLRFILRNPQFIGCRLINKYDGWAWSEFNNYFSDVFRMAADLGIDDAIEIVASLDGLDGLIKYHDRLVENLNKLSPSTEPLIEYPPPPFVGTESIVPVTNSIELAEEGKLMHHCVRSYHRDIFYGKYYVYRILRPERGTIGLRLNENKILIDQVHLSHNRQPSRDTLELINEWLTLRLKQ